MMFIGRFGLALAACVACSHNEQEPLVPASREQPPEAQEQQQPQPPAPEPQRSEAPRPEEPEAREGSLGLSKGVEERCKLPETRAASPQFDFDEAELRPRGMGILDGVAQCMQEGGALAGESVTVVGHADPRGTLDYNRGLGMRRAEAARRYLVSKGVPEARITVRSRGEAEAAGMGPSGWQLDRHVEVQETTPAEQ